MISALKKRGLIEAGVRTASPVDVTGISALKKRGLIEAADKRLAILAARDFRAEEARPH